MVLGWACLLLGLLLPCPGELRDVLGGGAEAGGVAEPWGGAGQEEAWLYLEFIKTEIRFVVTTGCYFLGW